jgi:hypothetical protein
VLGNFSAEPVTPRLPDAGAWAGAEVLVGEAAPDGGLGLAPWEGRAYRRGGGAQ